jgi:hypothetical protein
MLFNFPIRLRGEPAQAASVILAVHGRFLDSAGPGALAVTLNHSDRRAWWTNEGLILDHPVAIQFDAHTQRLLDRFIPEELPDAARKVLEAISRAGAEARLMSIVNGHPARLKISLILDDWELPAVQLGANFLLLKAPVGSKPVHARLIIEVNGVGRAWNVELPDGLPIKSPRVRVRAKPD